MIAAKAASVASSPTGKGSSKLNSKKSLEPHGKHNWFCSRLVEILRLKFLLHLISRFEGQRVSYLN